MNISIERYRRLDKGALMGTFNAKVSLNGLTFTLLDCKLFQTNSKSWWNPPQKEIKVPNQPKPNYIPLVTFEKNEAYAQLEKKILEEARAKHEITPPVQILERNTPPLWE